MHALPTRSLTGMRYAESAGPLNWSGIRRGTRDSYGSCDVPTGQTLGIEGVCAEVLPPSRLTPKKMPCHHGVARHSAALRLVLVGPDRFELSTYGLRVGQIMNLLVLSAVDTIYENQQVMSFYGSSTVDLHMCIFGLSAYRLPTDSRACNEWTKEPGSIDCGAGG